MFAFGALPARGAGSFDPQPPRLPASAEFSIGSHVFRPAALVLAPMEDVTSVPFRVLCRRYGADLVYTEFVHAALLAKGSRESVEKLRIDPLEHPVAVQIFGDDPDELAEAARVAMDAGPDFIDLNIGCPVRKIVCKGAGAALLRDFALVERIVRRVREVISVPLTAKARLAWSASDIRIIELARLLEANGVAALAVHARTREQGHDGDAQWEWIARVRESVSIPIFGNGDVLTPEDSLRMLRETGCHGVMLGRAAIGNPWVFREHRTFLATGEKAPPPTWEERREVILAHLRALVEERGEFRGVLLMRRHYAPYLRGAGDPARREVLVRAESVSEIEALLAPAPRHPDGVGPRATAGTSP